uniref:Olfactory receptor n=1 Tax=Jaculus jaculus TaxID=51337 RepID=A0A8C5K842_JACJA
MEKQNFTVISEFILMGITDHLELQALFFGLFFIIYVTSVVGNLSMILLTKMDSRLQTPMYFFLQHLSFIDFGYSTAVAPKMLVNLLAEQNTIPYNWCATQLALFIFFIISELFVLAAMAYDRYVAICNPLLYTVIMSKRVCWVLVALPYLYSAFLSLITTIKIFLSSFCSNNIISHFYCDSLPLLTIICSGTHDVELIILIFSAFNLLSSLFIILVSYLMILMSILRINSAEGRQKAFSTCAPHLTVVVSSHSFETDKMASLFYTLIIPMLNPMIYSFRNKEVKDVVHKLWKTI